MNLQKLTSELNGLSTPDIAHLDRNMDYALRTRKKLIRLATWNVRTLSVPGAIRILSDELHRYKIDIAAIQE